ncbi:hypothetical protein RchiOBHm_Chr4g0434291 [Rosa chinensis]|uniref:Uncharacterized protein n=1 Tax=Rosa chinensis TaxID=74649 RepID=A0A2P6R1H0_ROSCH|nr:transcriptional corepressor LEUNIG [Rosa chinensis]XP_040374862.1 transcriptional corepressor LEUNIG [Rosa chinensis]PRQ40275.1 hypothetical protein RchiOBHm_Chr4g0434291 [Rosa chinensis]
MGIHSFIRSGSTSLWTSSATKTFYTSSQPFHQLQMLTPQHQQQLMLAQQNLTSPSASDDSRRLRMLLNNRSMGLGKDGLSNSVGDVVPNVGSPLQAAGSMMPRGDTDMLMKVTKNQPGRKRKQPVSSSGHHVSPCGLRSIHENNGDWFSL